MARFPFAKSRPADIDWDVPDTLAFIRPVPLAGNEIRMGTRLTVRESLCAALAVRGRVADVFGPGRHELTAERLPESGRMLGWGANPPSAFAASLFYVQTGWFRDLSWSCDMPAGLGDGAGVKTGIRGSGFYSVRVADAGRLLGYLLESSRIFESDYLLGLQRSRIARAFAETCREASGEGGVPEVPANELVLRMERKLKLPFAEMGLELSDVRIADMAFHAEAGATGPEDGASRRPDAGSHVAGKPMQVTEEERLLLVSGLPAGTGRRYL